MKTLGYYNGKFGPLEEMTVPMNDRACYFGDGVYEATLARNGKIFALKEHLDRFFNSAGLIKILTQRTSLRRSSTICWQKWTIRISSSTGR